MHLNLCNSTQILILNYKAEILDSKIKLEQVKKSIEKFEELKKYVYGYIDNEPYTSVINGRLIATKYDMSRSRNLTSQEVSEFLNGKKLDF